MSQLTLDQAMQRAIAHHQAGRLADAESLYRQVLALHPNHVDALQNLGAMAMQLNQFEIAVQFLTRAAKLSPTHFDAHINLTTALVHLQKFDQAIAAGQQALAIKPNDPGALNNLGTAFKANGDLDQAITCFQTTLTLQPNSIQALNNLGLALQDTGRLDQAIACYHKVLALNPNLVAVHDTLLLALQYQGSPALADQNRRWNQQHAQPLTSLIQPHHNTPDPNRRLRIGYVSPDFRSHSIARFLLPLLENHDRTAVEIVCYAQNSNTDEMTRKLQSQTPNWRTIATLSDDQAAQIIRSDSIDILVDLAMHTANNRLLLFARKPAPVQASYLAYAGASALETIDYHLSDRYLDPIPDARSIQLNSTYWCYQQTLKTPPVNALPITTAGHITFGCLNTFCKISPAALQTWATLLTQIPNSHLLLFSPVGKHRDELKQFMQAQKISPDRIEYVGWSQAEKYFDHYHRIDIALDPFPFAGGTTTCDALWMGVPIITLAGQTPAARSGVSLLSNAGLPDLIASTPQHYIQLATNLANDLPRLTHLRSALRHQIQNSPLMDAPSVARSVETAYRAMWQTWCANQKPT